MFSKVLLGIVTILAGFVGYYAFTSTGQAPVAINQEVQSFDEEPISGKRGDDPIYSEEIKRNTALMIEAKGQAEQVKADLKNLQREAQQQNLHNAQAMREIKALIEANKSDSTVKDTSLVTKQVQSQIQAQSEQLNKALLAITETIEKSNAQYENRIRHLEEKLTAQSLASVVTDDISVETEPTEASVVKNGSNFIYPYGFDPNSQASDSGDGMVENIKGLLGLSTQSSNRLITPLTVDNNNPVPTLNRNNPVKEEQEDWETVFPVYTIPPNTVLANSHLVTPIIGKVPSGDSDISDPFFFKIEIGSDNLAANGQKIPGISKMIASGYATGIREQSCVRGYIDSLTFIFIDGRIVTQGEASKEGNSNGEAIGYLADKWGKPCIRGRYINNAKDYLMDRGLAAFIGAAAGGLAQSQVSNQLNSNGTSQAILNGNVWQFILGQGISGTANEFADYVRERTANAFDVVYVPQGQPDVQIWINKTIPIDYDSEGRKVNYYSSSSESSVGYD